DDILDISVCELSEVTGFNHCLTYILYCCMSLLPKGCAIDSLATLKVIQQHEPCLIVYLQILNVEKNHLKFLPDSIGDLRLLQTLNLKGNSLSELPSSVGCLSSLRTLDLSDNNIVQLPKALAYIHTLESFTLDAAKMSYPPASVCAEGTQSIQKFLCTELGEEYCPPSQYLLPVLENDCTNQSSDCFNGLEETWQNKWSDYEKRKEQKRQETLAFEHHLQEKQREYAQLLLMNTSHKENILYSVRQEQERLEQGLSQQQRAQEAERLLLLEKIRQAEDSISSRISNILMDNNRQKKSSEFLQALEEDRIRMEHLTAITQEEANSLRKREVAVAMQKMLSDNCAMSLLQQANDCRRQNLVSEVYRSIENLDKKLDKMLSLQVLDKSKAITQILEEEEMQKAAFQALQLQRDAVYGYIRNQIKLIEAELMQLTKLELKRRSLDAEYLQEVLGEQRAALSDLLQQLLKQKDQREQELREALVELELKSESNQQNYWMIQYQRLLDAKPLSLRMQEAGVEKELVNLLCKLSAEHYLPILAHHRVTAEALCHMTLSDLKKDEVAEVIPTAPSTASGPSFPNTSTIHIPSPPLTPGTPVTPSAPSLVEGPGNSECVVCMETGAQVIFLPCGHVCCCQVCSNILQNCPLCRSSISQHVCLYYS
uniref:Leucine rich repeat and sterile alpha motif containing 1 n=1 Tax=Mastacembelus armatus TaxID=205130 RepID=A0A7N9AZF4_9TELE